MKKRILFVCLGNICRSPAADGIMRALVAQRGVEHQFEIDSAGTYGGHAGELPDARMREAGARRGYSFTHRSRQFRQSDFSDFDMIVVMDDNNYVAVNGLAQSREDVEKVYRMSEFFSSFPNYTYVPDPYYEGREGFELVLDMLEEGCRAILAAEL